ncbi:hypothetical protein RhiJN_09130 [Ceratobasidium sp. AG-Ba]|nr:hypothetical protein RhiJN_09130 [Ceratobasidium sp. AG-Ba]
MLLSKTTQHIAGERTPEEPHLVLLPLEIQAMVIGQVAGNPDSDARIYSTETRNALRALCTVNKYFESIAIRYLYTLVHLTSASQLAAFRKAVAFFGKPTALAKHVRTFSMSTTGLIASLQLANDMAIVLHVLRPTVERLFLDIRRRHHFRQTTSSGGQDIGILQSGEFRSNGLPFSATSLFLNPWPKLIEVSVSEGLDQYLRLVRLPPRAFDNVRRLALGYTAITADFIDRLLEMPFLETLVMVNSHVRWSDFDGRSSPSEPIAALMRKSPALRRLVWLVTARPQWDMEESLSTNTVLRDTKMFSLCNVPGVKVVVQPKEQNIDDTLPDGLSGPCLVGESAKDGSLWEL